MKRVFQLMTAVAVLAMVIGGAWWWKTGVRTRRPAPASFHEGVLAVKEGRPAAAESAFRRAIAEDPRAAEAYAELGNLYLLRREWVGAIQALETASFLTPARGDVHAQLAQAYLEARRPEEAYRSVAAALKLAPRNTFALAVRGELLLRDDNLAEALGALQAAIRETPAFSLGYLKAGYVLVKMQRLDEAAKVIEEGLRHDPQNPGMHFQLAETYYSRPQLPEASVRAEEHYRLAIPNNPGAASAYARLGDLARRRGDMAAARGLWEQALKLDRAHPDALYALGQAEMRDGNRTAGRLYLERARDQRTVSSQLGDLKARAQSRPTDAMLACRVGRYALDRGLIGEAERQIEQAVRWAPELREARLLRAQLYTRLGRTEDARKEFEVGSALRP